LYIAVNDRLANVRVTVGETDTNFDDPPDDDMYFWLHVIVECMVDM